MSSSNCSKFDKDPCFLHLKEAFAKDGFTDIENCVEINGNLGIRASNPKALNYCTGKPKLAFYTEGSYYDMGYQLGYLAEDDVAEMTTTYVKDILGDIVVPYLCEEIKSVIGAILAEILLPAVKKLASSDAIPPMYNEQLMGLLAGCQKVNPDTKANLDGLKILNFGQDVLCSHVYTGHILKDKKEVHDVFEEVIYSEIERTASGFWKLLKKIFLGRECNAFSLKNGNPGDKDYYYYFGRDAMIQTGGVFQDTACLIIYNPDNTYKGIKALPTAVQSAPGMVFNMTGININGVAVGVDALPSAACDPENPGLNTNLLCRHCLDYGHDADGVVELIKNAQRGVSALYPFADGSTGKSGVVEAIMSIDIDSHQVARYYRRFPLEKPGPGLFDLLMGDYIENLGEHLPPLEFIKKHMQQTDNLKKGFFVRWSDYEYPKEYLDYDKGLWEYFNEKLDIFGKKELHKGALDPEGFINFEEKNSEKFKIETNCPSTYYFPPQRENNPDLFLCTNGSISPEIHFASMSYWLGVMLEVIGEMASQDDFQWRYDTLNKLIREALKKGPITTETAIGLIDFLNPLTGQYPKYYADQPKCKGEPQIFGSVNLFDLKENIIYSHFGYYCDEWVHITLPNYIRDKQ